MKHHQGSAAPRGRTGAPVYPLEGSTTTDHQVRGWTIARTALAVLALMIASIGTAVAIVRSGDGGAPSSFAGIATDASTFRMSSVMRFEAPEASNEITSEAWIDLRRKLARVTLDMPQAGAFEAIFTESHIYMQGFPGREPPPGKAWIRAPIPEQFGDAFSTFEAPTLIPIGPEVPPERFLPLLREVSISLEERGKDDVRGVPTTHYRARVDLDRLLKVVGDDLDESQRQWIRELRRMDTATIDLDIWLGDDGLPYRQETAMEFKGARMSMHAEIYDYGRPVDIEIPPEDQVHDDPNAFER